MKKIIYNIIKYPLILILIRTPLINILKNRFKYQNSLSYKSKIWLYLDIFFQREYFIKLKDKKKIRELTDLVLSGKEGKKWAQYYYEKHFKSLDELKKKKIGNIYANEALPIFEKMIKFIRSNNLSEDKNTHIIQLGSSSGRDLEFFLNIFPKLNYISTDVNEEILDFQKEKYNYLNIRYFKCYAEDINKCIEFFDLFDKNIIFFSNSSLQYVNPFFLKEFFENLKNYKKFNLFLNEPVNLSFISDSKLISEYRGNISFSHKYDEYANNSNLKVIEKEKIKPYPKGDANYLTGHSYLHISNN